MGEVTEYCVVLYFAETYECWRIPFTDSSDDTCDITQFLFIFVVIPMAYGIGKKLVIVLQTVMAGIEQVFCIPAGNAELDIFLCRYAP